MYRRTTKYHHYSYTSVLVSLLFSLLIHSAYSQDAPESSLKNKTLPKEIKLDPKTIQIIDSFFLVQNDVQKIETVQVYELKNSVLVAANRKYFVNDTLHQTTDELFDSNGSNIFAKIIFHSKNTIQIIERKLDQYGNLTEVKTVENKKQSILQYKNIYLKNKLVQQTLFSDKSNRAVKLTWFKYDGKGNLLEELVNNNFNNTKNTYQYNKANQVVMHKHNRNGVLNDSTIYYYSNGLLQKKEWYEQSSTNPMSTTYEYNNKKQLINENENNFYYKIEYKNHDTFGNWQLKEQSQYEKIYRLTKRTFISQ